MSFFPTNNCKPTFAHPCASCFRLAAVRRELKVKEMHLQDAARRRFLKLQQDQQEMELRRLDDEIERKVYFSYQYSYILPLFSFKCKEHL